MRIIDWSSDVCSADLDGQVVRMVDERRRAWHAGQYYWRRITDVNSASVGIEIVNPGHELGYRPFPEAQMAALLPLLSEIVGRHGVTPANVVGHSDIAPARKVDQIGRASCRECVSTCRSRWSQYH